MVFLIHRFVVFKIFIEHLIILLTEKFSRPVEIIFIFMQRIGMLRNNICIKSGRGEK